MVMHICSMCSMAGTASRLAFPLPLENQQRSPTTSFHTTFTIPYLVQTVARRGRSHRFRWIERMRGYLAAATFYEMIFGENVEGNSFVPTGLSAGDAQTLRRAAHEAVANEAPHNSAHRP